MNRSDLNPYTRRRLLQLSLSALKSADVEGIVPTPLEAVAAAAGVQEILDISDIPDVVAAQKPAAWKQILGAFMYKERVVFVDRSQHEPRERFTEAHETAHRLIPWHEGCYELDNEVGLFGHTQDHLDLEANAVAAYLIFQGLGFQERALDFAVSIETPVALAEDFRASLHAAIRYYTEHHPDPIALLILGRFPGATRTLPIWHSIESESYRTRFGRLSEFFPDGRLRLDGGDENSLGALASRTLVNPDPVCRSELLLPDLRGEPASMVSECFFNRRCVFVMLVPQFKLPRGRRARVIMTQSSDSVTDEPVIAHQG